MHHDPLTPLGRALMLCLLWTWQRLRTEANMPRQVPLALPVYVRMTHAWARLRWLVVRLDQLALRWQQGTLPKPRRRRSRPAASTSAAPTSGAPIAASALPAAPTPAAPIPAAPVRPPRLRDPSQQGWLARIWQPARGAGSVLGHLLASDPDLRALHEAAPQAGRLLRPLCRMLGTPLPDWLRLPPRPPRPRKPRPAVSSSACLPGKAGPSPSRAGTPDRPLPAYVRAAVRAWKPRYG